MDSCVSTAQMRLERGRVDHQPRTIPGPALGDYSVSTLETPLKDSAKHHFCLSCDTEIRYEPGADANKPDICANCFLKLHFSTNVKKEDSGGSNPSPPAPTVHSAGWVTLAAPRTLQEVKERGKEIIRGVREEEYYMQLDEEHIDLKHAEDLKQKHQEHEIDTPATANLRPESHPETDLRSPSPNLQSTAEDAKRKHQEHEVDSTATTSLRPESHPEIELRWPSPNVQSTDYLNSSLQVPSSRSVSLTFSSRRDSQSSTDISLLDDTDDDSASVVTDYSSQFTLEDRESQSEYTYLLFFLREFGFIVARDVVSQVRDLLEGNGCFVSHTGSSPSSVPSQDQPMNASTSSNAQASSAGKRPCDDDGSAFPNDDDPGGDPNKKRKTSGSSSPSQPVIWKFACPFYKRDPAKHQKWRSCSGPGWNNSHRLKAHVYRRHAIPIHCTRCWVQFETEEDLMKHSRAQESCKLLEAVKFDGYNKEQEKQLRCRKRPPKQAEEDRWFEMYRILFPEDNFELTPSPYYHVDEKTVQVRLLKFREFLKEKLPKKMWTDLQPDLGVFAQDQKAELERRFVKIVQDCTDHYFEVFQKSLLSPPSTPGSSGEPKESVPQQLQAPLDQLVVVHSVPNQTNLVLIFDPSTDFTPPGTSEPIIEDHSPSQNTATDTLANVNPFQGPLHETPFDMHGNSLSHTLPSRFVSTPQNSGMATSEYLAQYGSPPPSSFTSMPDYNLPNSQDSTNPYFDAMLSSIGSMNPSQFGWNNNWSSDGST